MRHQLKPVRLAAYTAQGQLHRSTPKSLKQNETDGTSLRHPHSTTDIPQATHVRLKFSSSIIYSDVTQTGLWVASAAAGHRHLASVRYWPAVPVQPQWGNHKDLGIETGKPLDASWRETRFIAYHE